MRRSRSSTTHFIGVAFGLTGLVVVGLTAAVRQSPPTEEEYGPLMTEIRLTVGDADLHVDARYWPELGEDLDKLFPMAQQGEAFWTARGNDGAVGCAQQMLAALKELSDAAIAQDRGAARAGVVSVRATCQPCHEAHREETDDGYRVKPGS